jgi:Raf kinase inhibitor-like YbhB/YbcL family protein
MELLSTAFIDGGSVPPRHTADGADVSVPLSWSDTPSETAEFALIVDDPDAPTSEPWVHWVVYGLPADARELPEGVPQEGSPTRLGGGLQGVNSFSTNRIGYRGPAPPQGHGPHHYRFTLYALRRPVGLPPGATKGDLIEAMEGLVLESARLTGIYER